jgi:hypothetical protein
MYREFTPGCNRSFASGYPARDTNRDQLVLAIRS